MTPLQTAALDLARSTVAGAVADLVDDAQAEHAARRAVPHRWALYHGRMAETLPGWRWVAVRHHRRMARVYAALAWADDQLAPGCTGAHLAERLGLPR